MFCKNCGAELSDDVNFCTRCGSRTEEQSDGIENLLGIPAEYPETSLFSRKKQRDKAQKSKAQENKVQEDIVQKQEKLKRGRSKERQRKAEEEESESSKGKNVRTVLSVLFSLLIILLGLCASAVFLVRCAVSNDVIDTLVQETDIADIRINFLVGGDSEGLADFIAKNAMNAGDKFAGLLQEENIRKLLNERFVKRFLSEKLKNYVEDLFEKTGNGVIRERELERLLEKNEEIICEILKLEDQYYTWWDPDRGIYNCSNLEWKDVSESFMTELRSEGILRRTELSVYRERLPEAFSLIEIAFSGWMQFLFLAILLLLSADVFLLQKRKVKWLCYTGVSLLLVGAANFFTAIMTDPLAAKLNKSTGLGRGFWKRVLEPVRAKGMAVGGILAAVGVFVCLIYIIVREIRSRHIA